MDPAYYRELVRPLVAGRKWILAGAPLAAFTRTVQLLRDLGGQDPFIIASSPGTGEVPEAEWIDLRVRADTMMEGFRRTAALLRALPDEARRAIDRYDPDRRAVVMGSPFLPEPTLHGRPVYGWRRPEWLALEDKVVVDEIWDAAGVPRLPSTVVPALFAPLHRASSRLDRGAGTVWQGDAREGFNGGAEYLRWVRRMDEAAEAVAFFGEHCERVRVTPFAEGIPCSIHGMVFPGEVVRFRPVELITLRRPGESRLHYAGTATFWDPPDADRVVMRNVATRVGERLAATVDYRGAFTVDGILAEEGFRPTELNTRAGAGLFGVTSASPELPFGLVNLCLIAEEGLDYRPRSFEKLVVEAADERRGGGGMSVVPGPRTETEERALIEEGGRYRPARQDEESDATLSLGPSDVGGFVRFAPIPERTPVGRSLAPRVVDALRMADEIWGLDIGSLEPPASVR